MDYSKYIDIYSDKVEEYSELGESILPFKSFGAKSGVYQERCGTSYMVRPRTTGGVIDLDILKAVRDISSRYSDGSIRLSTRQDFQFHKVELFDTVSVMKELERAGLYSIGSGGNTTRNVAASPMSGLQKDEAFDITEYAKIAGEYLSQDENNLALPRKFKVSFSSGERDSGSVTFADIGFLAKVENGKKLFKVYGGGGLGPAARISMVIAESIDASDMLYYLDAMVEFFRAEGDRENRAKARLRHLVKKYGEDEFKSRYASYLEASRQKDLAFKVEEMPEKERPWASKTRVKSVFLEETKQEGIYGVYIHPQGGRLTKETLNTVLEFLESLDHGVELRITNTQSLLLRDLGGREAKDIITLIRKEISDAEIMKSVCCVGADTCRVGINSSQGLLEDIYRELRKLDHKIRRELPKLHISGCPSSCGQHQIGVISFSGKRKNIDGESRESYAVYFGGNLGYEVEPKFAERYGDILKEDIPIFLKSLAKLKYNSGISDIYEFVEEKDGEIRALIEKYGV